MAILAWGFMPEARRDGCARENGCEKKSLNDIRSVTAGAPHSEGVGNQQIRNRQTRVGHPLLPSRPRHLPRLGRSSHSSCRADPGTRQQQRRPDEEKWQLRLRPMRRTPLIQCLACYSRYPRRPPAMSPPRLRGHPIGIIAQFGGSSMNEGALPSLRRQKIRPCSSCWTRKLMRRSARYPESCGRRRISTLETPSFQPSQSQDLQTLRKTTPKRGFSPQQYP